MSIYIRLGARASSFHDFASKVTLSGKEVLELPSMPEYKFFKKALHSGHIVLCSKVDFDEFTKSTTNEAPAADLDKGGNGEEDFIYIEPKSNSKEDILASMETIKDLKTLVKWCKSFGFEKGDLEIVKKLNKEDLEKAKSEVVEMAVEYTD